MSGRRKMNVRGRGQGRGRGRGRGSKRQNQARTNQTNRPRTNYQKRRIENTPQHNYYRIRGYNGQLVHRVHDEETCKYSGDEKWILYLNNVKRSNEIFLFIYGKGVMDLVPSGSDKKFEEILPCC